MPAHGAPVRQMEPVNKEPEFKELAVIPPCYYIKGCPEFKLWKVDGEYFIRRFSVDEGSQEYGPFDRTTAGDYWIAVLEEIESR